MFQHSTNWMSRQFPCDVTGLEFDCEAKKLQEIPDGITSNATVVNLSKNDLQQIPGNAFSHLENLIELNLYKAKKRGLQNADIKEYAFKNLTKLLSLDLSNNRLTHIPGDLPPSLTTIWLNNNRFLVLNEDL